jgi:hypothetical protein
MTGNVIAQQTQSYYYGYQTETLTQAAAHTIFWLLSHVQAEPVVATGTKLSRAQLENSLNYGMCVQWVSKAVPFPSSSA